MDKPSCGPACWGRVTLHGSQAVTGAQRLAAAQEAGAATQHACRTCNSSRRSASSGLGGVSSSSARGLGADAQTAGAGGIGAYERAIGGIDDVAAAARNVAGQARTGGQTAAQQAAAQTQSAITGARGITSDAARALQQAGALGTQTAQSGIAGLAGTTGAYDPASAGSFMNQYEDAAVQQALADVRRAGEHSTARCCGSSSRCRCFWRITSSSSTRRA